MKKTNISLNELSAVTIYGVAMFVSASLMFLIEPFVAKSLLPVLGGGPNIWNGCVLFFQITLLIGYAYAHVLTSRVSKKWQLLLHMVVLWLPLLFLPCKMPMHGPSDMQPMAWLLVTLVGAIGSLFFSLSATAPLLQRWFATRGTLGASDPYFLFAASNLGSFVGLFAYPFLVEANFSMVEQNQLFTIGYLCFALLVTGAALFLLSKDVRRPMSSVESSDVHETGSPKLVQYLRWLVFTLVPSSLVLGLTTHVTTELSSIPLFWIVPLAVYLASFVVAFGRCPVWISLWARRLAPFMVALSLIVLASDNAYYLSGGDSYVTTWVSVHLVTLFFVCIACHCRVADERPAFTHLTKYYLAISFGGVLGSAFNTLFAPTLFKGAEEFPLMLICAGIILARGRSAKYVSDNTPVQNIVIPLAVLAVAAVCWSGYALTFSSSAGRESTVQIWSEICLRFVVPIAVCALIAKNQLQLKYGLAVIGSIVLLHLSNSDPSVVYKERNFFGRVSVATTSDNNSVQLWNGVSLHGTESLNPLLRGKSLVYFCPEGRIGEVLSAIDATTSDDGVALSEERRSRAEFVAREEGRTSKPASTYSAIAVIGLGCGVGATVAKSGQSIVFYEINPQVVQIASNPFFFTYLYDAKKRGVDVKIVTGDGRLGIQQAPYNYYQLIVQDAYNSSSIPTHLITKEALETYLKKLKSGGAIAFNLNSYYDLKPVLGKAAKELGLSAVIAREFDQTSSTGDSIEWVVLSKNKQLVEDLRTSGWKTLEFDPRFRLWTDGYSNPLEVLKSKFS